MREGKHHGTIKSISQFNLTQSTSYLTQSTLCHVSCTTAGLSLSLNSVRLGFKKIQLSWACFPFSRDIFICKAYYMHLELAATSQIHLRYSMLTGCALFRLTFWPFAVYK